MDRASEIAALGARCTRRVRGEAPRARDHDRRVAPGDPGCAASIRATHRGEYDAAAKLADEARASSRRSRRRARRTIPTCARTARSPTRRRSYAEACLTLALVRDDPLPTPRGPAARRRAVLQRPRRSRERAAPPAARPAPRRRPRPRRDSSWARWTTSTALLVTVDYPDGVTGGLRRSTDALRAVLERTRGDLTTAMVAARLQGAIESARATPRRADLLRAAPGALVA